MVWILIKEEKIPGILLSLNEEPLSGVVFSQLSEAIVCSNSGLLFVIATTLYSSKIKALTDSEFLTLSLFSRTTYT